MLRRDTNVVGEINTNEDRNSEQSQQSHRFRLQILRQLARLRISTESTTTLLDSTRARYQTALRYG